MAVSWLLMLINLKIPTNYWSILNTESDSFICKLDRGRNGTWTDRKCCSLGCSEWEGHFNLLWGPTFNWIMWLTKSWTVARSPRQLMERCVTMGAITRIIWFSTDFVMSETSIVKPNLSRSALTIKGDKLTESTLRDRKYGCSGWQSALIAMTNSFDPSIVQSWADEKIISQFLESHVSTVKHSPTLKFKSKGPVWPRTCNVSLPLPGAERIVESKCADRTPEIQLAVNSTLAVRA